ncbi:MAG: hypothetical protein ACI9MR_003037 [Myxococcota bacterium]|jgi:hypothetical protein
MKILVAGYAQDELARISDALRGAGHQVMGAPGKHGAQAFVRAVIPDCLMAPGGEGGKRVRIWLAGLTDGFVWVEVDPGEDPLEPLTAFEGVADEPATADLTKLDEAIIEVADEVSAVEETARPNAAGRSERSPARTIRLSREPMARMRTEVGLEPRTIETPTPEPAADDLITSLLETTSWSEPPEESGEPDGAPTIRSPIPAEFDATLDALLDVVNPAPAPALGPHTFKDTSPPNPEGLEESELSVSERLSRQRSKATARLEPTGARPTPTRPPTPMPEKSALDSAGARPAASPGGAAFTMPWTGRGATPTNPPADPHGKETVSPLPKPTAPSRPVTAQVVIEPVEDGMGRTRAAPAAPRLPSAGAPSSSRAMAGPIPDAASGISRPIADASHHPDIVSKLAQSRFGDYHSLLEIEIDASPFVVREQFQRLSERYTPSGWPDKLSPDELEMLLEVGSSLRDAFLILSDAEFRARYEQALSSIPAARRQ